MFLSLCLPVSCYVSLPFSPPGNSNSAREGGRKRGERDEGMTYNDAGRVGEEKENRTARTQTPSCHIPGIFSFSPFFLTVSLVFLQRRRKAVTGIIKISDIPTHSVSHSHTHTHMHMDRPMHRNKWGGFFFIFNI